MPVYSQIVAYIYCTYLYTCMNAPRIRKYKLSMQAKATGLVMRYTHCRFVYNIYPSKVSKFLQTTQQQFRSHSSPVHIFYYEKHCLNFVRIWSLVAVPPTQLICSLLIYPCLAHNSSPPHEEWSDCQLSAMVYIYTGIVEALHVLRCTLHRFSYASNAFQPFTFTDHVGIHTI